MVNRVVVLRDLELSEGDRINWSRIGRVVSELSELYQAVKESRVDLILADETLVTISQSIARRIRRYNPLTEIWGLTSDQAQEETEEGPLDGTLSLQLGSAGMVKKVQQILTDKDRLDRQHIVGRSAAMKAISETIERIAPTEVSVLVVGPSGSGKELVARALHNDSARAEAPFVTVNCGAIAEGVLESELFGHERGAFTGSVAKREGLFHKSAGGTIFLDEIGEMKPDMQVKLLRVLEDGTYYPVGSSTPQRADARVVAATNRDLTEAIADRQFREDLYFRVGAVKIVVPSLLERRSDIQPLLQHFLAEAPNLTVSDSALDLLTRYDWPGNVRQLRNFATRMVALRREGIIEPGDVEAFISEQHASATHLPVSTGRTVEEAGQELIYRAILSLGNEIRLLRDLITAHLPGGTATASDESPLKFDQGSSMEEMERALIEQVLSETGGNRKETAGRLGIGERTLYRKLKKYNLQ
ncbi:MAG: sigma-54-dependent Fis family transcriptional regulator [Candidatus Zixiibacteriota bacterium]|nr:MAG: sigma-54-dependent Fis family transcriptional regulator [candidate division Zixibacteria bacterium]